MKLSARNLTPRIGAEIKSDRGLLLAGNYAGEIRDLLEQTGVLVFRGLNFNEAEQLEFTRTLGKVRSGGDTPVYRISLDRDVNATADLLYGAFCWHFDGTTDDIPSRASMLSPQRLSETGGQTEFANTYASYADLPELEKQAFDSLRVVHVQETIQRQIFPYPTEEQLKRWASQPVKTHPLVWNHKSGRKSLVLGLTATSIEGMEAVEGRALLRRLQEWATQPQYIYRHEWQLGDLVLWDNTGVIHRVQYFPVNCGRMLNRTTLLGEEQLSGAA